MNNNTNGLDNQYLLKTPLAYVLQDKKVSEIEEITDDNGWNVLHWAVATANVPKVKELIHFLFNCKIITKNNFIPREIYVHHDKKKSEEIKKPIKIPFCNRGFTPAHLAMFLYNNYNGIDDFFYELLTEKYNLILSLLIKNGVLQASVTEDEFSLFDYAFLLEDVKSIELLHMHDPEFKTLNKIKVVTAKAIIETMDIKYGKCGIEHILDSLNVIILKQDLEANLPKNNKFNNTTIKKL